MLLGVGVLLSGLLAMSFRLSGTGLEDAEATAETRAEQFAEAFLFTELTPDLLARDIMGTPYRDLLISVQAGILSDHRVVRLRIWKAGGDLIFSTAQRDKVDEFFARENDEITRASQGETVSAATGRRVPPVDGLEGSGEKLYQTYVPLEIDGAVAPFAVVQIDQRYASIEDAANRIWRLVQMFLILALIGFAGVAAISLRQSPGAEPASADQPRQPRRSREERKRRDEEARALSSEHAERQAGMGQRIAQAGPRIREMAPEKAREMGQEKAPPGVRKRLEETELKLRAEQAEREQLAGEIQRLRAALAEKEAELALEREGPSADSADTTRIAELEAALKDAERRATEVPASAKRDKAAKVNTDLRKAQLEIEDLKLRLAEAERSTEGLGAARAVADESQSKLEQAKAIVDAANAATEEARVRMEEASAAAEEARAVAAEAKAEARRAKEEAAALAAETEDGKAELARAVFEAERLQNELERRGADVERLREELEGAAAQVSRVTAEREAAAIEAAGAVRQADAARASAAKRGAPDLAALQARIEEMESQRRSDVSELQVAQQSLANTQFELMEATRKLKAAEERLAGEGDDDRAEGSRPTRRPRAERSRVRHPEPYRESEPARDLEPTEEEMAVFHAAESQIDAPSAPAADEESDEDLAGLSLRERLARAAAARHRTGPSS